MRTAKDKKPTEIEIVNIEQGEMTFHILGQTPFYCNRVANKSARELLYPRAGKLTTAQKASRLKHDPLTEFRDSPYLQREMGPTRILMKSTAFKGAMASAAIDMPTDVARAQINRLVYLVGDWVPIWGIPRLDMQGVIQAGIGRTPDIRTRARIEQWATQLTIRFTKPMLNPRAVGTLLAAAGMIIGVGDFRQEKGKGSNGLFRAVAADDPEYLEVIALGGRAVQDAALADPECSNSETEELYTWFQEEFLRRGNTVPDEDDGEEEEVAIAAE